MSLVVIGTDTGVGKTVISALILARYGRRRKLAYWKPIQSGASEGTDRSRIERWTRGLAETLEEEYCFRRPLSPHLAARLERKTIDPERVLAALVRHAMEDARRNLVIEGVGGLLVPLTERGYLLADLLREMALPCLVVARTALGTINHTLLALEAARARGIPVAGVVLSGPRNEPNREAIERFGKIQVVAAVEPIRPLGRAGILQAARSFDRRGVLEEYFET